MMMVNLQAVAKAALLKRQIAEAAQASRNLEEPVLEAHTAAEEAVKGLLLEGNRLFEKLEHERARTTKLQVAIAKLEKEIRLYDHRKLHMTETDREKLDRRVQFTPRRTKNVPSVHKLEKTSIHLTTQADRLSAECQKLRDNINHQRRERVRITEQAARQAADNQKYLDELQRILKDTDTAQQQRHQLVEQKKALLATLRKQESLFKSEWFGVDKMLNQELGVGRTRRPSQLGGGFATHFVEEESGLKSRLAQERWQLVRAHVTHTAVAAQLENLEQTFQGLQDMSVQAMVATFIDRKQRNRDLADLVVAQQARLTETQDDIRMLLDELDRFTGRDSGGPSEAVMSTLENNILETTVRVQKFERQYHMMQDNLHAIIPSVASMYHSICPRGAEAGIMALPEDPAQWTTDHLLPALGAIDARTAEIIQCLRACAARAMKSNSFRNGRLVEHASRRHLAVTKLAHAFGAPPGSTSSELHKLSQRDRVVVIPPDMSFADLEDAT